MHKKTIAIFAIIFFMQSIAFAAYAEESIVESPTAILIDGSTGRILYEKNIHQRMYPASITKIMTAIIALENGNLKDIVTASSKAIQEVEPGSSHIGILPNEQFTLEQLLYALLIASANDGANIIAEHIAGSIDKFVELMNNRAIELGAGNTHFVNTHGYHDDNHYTTAYDVALIARHAMTIPKFKEIVSTATYEIPPTEKCNQIRYLSNTNHLINRYRATRAYNYFYPSATGIKTGYTSKAQHTLVSSAVEKDLKLIAVVMGAECIGNTYYSYKDTLNLFKYGFNNFSTQTIVKANDIIEEMQIKDAKDNEYAILLAEQDLKALLPKNLEKDKILIEIIPQKNISAPISKNDVLATAIYKYDGEVLGTINLISDRDVKIATMALIRNKTIAIVNVLWFKVLEGVFAILLITIVILRIRKSIRKKRRNYTFARKSYLKYYSRDKKW